MSHIWMSHVTESADRQTQQKAQTDRLNRYESCHTYEWVMSHIWMSHVTHMNESRTESALLLSLCDCAPLWRKKKCICSADFIYLSIYVNTYVPHVYIFIHLCPLFFLQKNKSIVRLWICSFSNMWIDRQDRREALQCGKRNQGKMCRWVWKKK